MKKWFLLVAAIWLGLYGVTAQNLVLGAKIPDFKLARWLTEAPSEEEKHFVFIEFFYSTNPVSVERLVLLDEWADRYKDRLRVVVLTKEDSPEVAEKFRLDQCRYYVGLDDGGKTFAAYGVQYVPYGVVADRRGRVVWLGNSAQLDEETLKKLLDNDLYKDRPLRKPPQKGAQ